MGNHSKEKTEKPDRAALRDRMVWTPKSVIRKQIREFRRKLKCSSNCAVNVRFPSGGIAIAFEDGRVLVTPLALHPTLEQATPAQRRDFEIQNGEAIYWPKLQYDILVIQMLNPFAGCCG